MMLCVSVVFFFKQKTAYEMRISDWSSDVCSSDLLSTRGLAVSHRTVQRDLESLAATFGITCDTRSKPYGWRWPKGKARLSVPGMEWPEALSFRLLQDYLRSEVHTSELQSLMRISYAVFCLKKNNKLTDLYSCHYSQ